MKGLKNKLTIAFMAYCLVAFLVPIVANMGGLFGFMYVSDKLSVSFPDTFSGSDNEVSMSFNNVGSEIRELNAFIDTDQIFTYGYNPYLNYRELPSSFWVSYGDSEGGIENLTAIGDYIKLSTKKKCFFSHQLSAYFVFNLDIHSLIINESNLVVFLNSSKNKKLKIEVLLDDEFSTIFNSQVTPGDLQIINYSIPDTLFNSSTLVFKYTGSYSSKVDFFLHKMYLDTKYIENTTEDILFIDSTSFPDDFYNLKIEAITSLLDVYSAESVIYIDNTPPLITINSIPANESSFNDTDIILFDFIIEDYCNVTTRMFVEVNDTDEYIIDFNGSKSVYYQDNYLEGNYTCSLVVQDQNGLTSVTTTYFNVSKYVEPPIIIINENTITLTCPSSTPHDSVDYNIGVSIEGSLNYSYVCNVTDMVNSVLQSVEVGANDSQTIIMDLFDTDFLVKLFNANKSMELVMNETCHVVKLSPPTTTTEDLIMLVSISRPTQTSNENGYNIIIEVVADGNLNISYSITFDSDDTLLTSGYMDANTAQTLFLSIFNETLNIVLEYEGDQFYSSSFSVSLITPISASTGLPPISLDLLNLLFTIGFFIISLIGLFLALKSGGKEKRGHTEVYL